MSIHQCPKCDLRFSWNTELDDHCRTDHPEFHHDYPVAVHEAVEPEAPPVVVPDPGRTSKLLSTWWSER